MKKNHRSFVFVFLTGFLVTLLGVAAAPDVDSAPQSVEQVSPVLEQKDADGLVYILPIRGPIEPALLYVVRRGLSEARTKNVSAVVFPMDTPGGAVNITEKIVELIARMDVPTYTFVEHNAISAGAIIALSTDKIYMTPGSKIGDAMPIMMAPGGGVQPLPDAEREKIMSYVDSMVRGVAQRKGRDETLASAMVRPDIEFVVDGVVISKEGQLLTLTNVEAERRFGEDQRPLLSEGTVDNLEDFLNMLGFAPEQRVELVVSTAERLARFLQMIGPLLMMVGFLGIYLEFQSPGFGVPGIVGVICLILFFAGHHIAGLAGNEVILIFLLGCSLIFIELFILPGFGVIGITGLMLVLWSLLNAMVERFPGDPWVPSFPSLQLPMLKLASSIIGATIGAAVLGRLLPQSNAFQNRLVLNESTSRDAGFTSNSLNKDLMGQEGVALSALYPAGTAMFGDRRVDVISRGDYVDQGTRVRVVELHGHRVVVEKMSESSDKA